MPDQLQELMMHRPLNVAGDVQYPKPGDPGVVDDKVMRGVGTALGIDEQQPGDAAGAIGAMASMLPIGAIGKLANMLKLEHAATPILHQPIDAELGVFKKLPKWANNAKETLQTKWPHPSKSVDPNYRRWAPAGSFDLKQPGLPEVVAAGNNMEMLDRRNMDILEHALKSKDFSKAPTLESARLSFAKQQPLPNKGTPMISYDPEVPAHVAENASKYLHEVAGRNANEGAPAILNEINSIHLTPKGGGVYDRSANTIEAGIKGSGGGLSSSLNDTLGHEFRHAIDQKNNPDVFKNYPNTMFSYFSTPEGYYSHPSEIRARASGALENFIHDSDKAGQEIIDRGVLGPMAHGIESNWGAAAEEANKLRATKHGYVKPRYEQYDSGLDVVHQPNLPEVYDLDAKTYGLGNHPNPVASGESDEDKLYRLMRERMLNAMEGKKDPRVPNPSKGEQK